MSSSAQQELCVSLIIWFTTKTKEHASNLLRALSISSIAINLIATTAGWRNNAVHPQIFHRLSVMIKAVGHGKSRAEKFGNLTLTKRAWDHS
jgi:hypothetical protein